MQLAVTGHQASQMVMYVIVTFHTPSHVTQATNLQGPRRHTAHAPLESSGDVTVLQICHVAKKDSLCSSSWLVQAACAAAWANNRVSAKQLQCVQHHWWQPAEPASHGLLHCRLLTTPNSCRQKPQEAVTLVRVNASHLRVVWQQGTQGLAAASQIVKLCTVLLFALHRTGQYSLLSLGCATLLPTPPQGGAVPLSDRVHTLLLHRQGLVHRQTPDTLTQTQLTPQTR